MNSTAYIHIFVRILVSLSVIYFYFHHLYKNRISRFCNRRVEIICGTFLLTFFLLGCLPSLHPLYTDDTLIFDEQLVGKWHGDDNIWTFSKSGEKEYELKISDMEGKEVLLQVHLVEIGSHRYLDLFPYRENREELFPYWIPVHTFMKVELSDPNLQFQWVVLGELIEEYPNLLKHEIIPEENRVHDEYGDYPFLITARSEDIQRVILQYPEQITEDSGDSGVLKRCPSIFKEKDIIFEEKLLGQWISEDDDYIIDFIQSGNNGCNIKFREKEEDELRFDGILYRFNGQSILGLYTKKPSQNEIESGLHLIPDYFLLVDYVEDELRSWQLGWEDMEKYKVKDIIYDFDALKEPDIVFKKKSKESKNDK